MSILAHTAVSALPTYKRLLVCLVTPEYIFDRAQARSLSKLMRRAFHRHAVILSGLWVFEVLPLGRTSFPRSRHANFYPSIHLMLDSSHAQISSNFIRESPSSANIFTTSPWLKSQYFAFRAFSPRKYIKLSILQSLWLFWRMHAPYNLLSNLTGDLNILFWFWRANRHKSSLQ